MGRAAPGPSRLLLAVARDPRGPSYLSPGNGSRPARSESTLARGWAGPRGTSQSTLAPGWAGPSRTGSIAARGVNKDLEDSFVKLVTPELATLMKVAQNR